MTEERFIEILDARFGALIGELDRRFEQIDRRFEQIDRRFERLETEVRLLHVEVESLRHEIRKVAEGVIVVDEKLERFRLDTTRRFEELAN